MCRTRVHQAWCNVHMCAQRAGALLCWGLCMCAANAHMPMQLFPCHCTYMLHNPLSICLYNQLLLACASFCEGAVDNVVVVHVCAGFTASCSCPFRAFLTNAKGASHGFWGPGAGVGASQEIAAVGHIDVACSAAAMLANSLCQCHSVDQRVDTLARMQQIVRLHAYT